MVIKLDNVNEWVRWSDLSKAVVLHGSKRRRIRIEINASAPVCISLAIGPLRDELFFLANVEGYQIIDFIADNHVHVVCDPQFDGTAPDVFYYTADNETVSAELPERRVFAKPHFRAARNPELEALQLKMMQNMDRRLAAMQRDTSMRDAELARLIAEREANHVGNQSTPSASSTSGQEVPEQDDSAGDEDPAAVNGGIEPTDKKPKAKR